MGKKAGGEMTAVKRIEPARSAAVIVDLQCFFLAQIPARERARVKTNTANFMRLVGAFGMPVTVTLERPVEIKGVLPREVARRLPARAKTFEKDFFDLSKERKIKAHLASLKRRQLIVAGCETDVCVMQSCLGLLALGYEVFVMEELIFSSTRNAAAALVRMRDAGCVFMTYKMLYYELIASVEGPGARFDAFGPFPEDLPDAAV
jgi:nicotinamidase-related amidase